MCKEGGGGRGTEVEVEGELDKSQWGGESERGMNQGRWE